MSLTTYNKKRNFKKTPEPKGIRAKNHTKLQYVIQKHAASHLHYDFRLELDGVLKSWAIPKGPSLNPKIKRLAVEVEDHPLNYGKFQGVIPKGEYGGGTVMLWDRGHWQSADEKPAQAYKKGKLHFKLRGDKLQGEWKLVRMHNLPKQWLLIKVNDEFANDNPHQEVTEEMPLSVLNKQSLEDIAESSAKVWHSNKAVKMKKKSSTTAIHKISGIKKVPMPKIFSPQLASLSAEMPKANDWIYEIKFDGYRLLSFINNKKVNLITRGKKDWTQKFKDIAEALQKLPVDNAIVDGEIVALDKNHKSNFQSLQNAIDENKSIPLSYYIFDIVYLNGFDLTQVPLLQRKEILKKLLANAPKNIRFSEHLQGDPTEILTHACKMKLEGIIAKQGQSPYEQRRTKSWLKIKCHLQQEFVVVGFTKPSGSREHFGALLLGYYDDKGNLHYCGNVGTGFNQASLKSISVLLKNNITTKRPFTSFPKGAGSITWVKPKLVAEVEFTEWTLEGSLRHPSFKGLRLDKPAKQVIKENPVKKIPSHTDNFSLTHPDKVLYPESNITKLDLARYYQQISEWILPHVKERPLTLVRCPNGYNKSCFYQKHLSEKEMGDISAVKLKEKSGFKYYPYIDDEKGLIALVQLGVLEIHSWGSHVGSAEIPDQMIFDIDPAPDVKWTEVIATAKLIRDELAEQDLISFVKTTGGKGLHVVVPIHPQYDWETIKTFSHVFVEYLVAKYPKRYVSTISKKKRVGKIFIDYLRNQRGATAVTPYSTRAREHAPISVPLAWQELTANLNPLKLTVKTVPNRLKRLQKDPWREFFKLKQKLPIK